jgi:hypothetical protein
MWFHRTILKDTHIHLHIFTFTLKTIAVGHYASLTTLVQLLETLLKDICRKLPYGFPCGSDDLFGHQKSTPT